MPDDIKADFAQEAGPSLKTVLTVYDELIKAGKLPTESVEQSRADWASIRKESAEARSAARASLKNLGQPE